MNARRNERGVVLALALWMLVILGLLGTVALSMTNTEIRLAGNNRNAQTAFFAADAAVQYARTAPTVLPMLSQSNPTWTVGGTGLIAIGANSTAQNVMVTYLREGPAPPLPGQDQAVQINDEPGGSFKGLYFLIQATGVGPNNAQAGIETLTATIVPDSGT
jgi:hypothetical protein